MVLDREAAATPGAAPNAPAERATSDWQLPAAFAGVVGLALLAALYAALEWRSLYADGSFYFLTVLTRHGFALMEPARRTVHVLQQFPTVLALRIGISRLDALAVIFGLSLQALPLVLTASCYPVLPREQKPLFLFPLGHFLLGTMAASFAPIVEGPVAAAYFWLLLFLILFGRGRVAAVAAVCLALPALSLHETTVLLMPTLAAVSALRAWSEARRSWRVLWWLLAAWFVAIALVQAGFIMYPRSEERRRDVVMTARVLFGVGNFNSINVPAILAIAALGAAAAICRPGAGPRAGWRTVSIFGAFTIAVIVATAVRGELGRLFAPGLQFAGRNLAVIVSAPLAILLLLARRRAAGQVLRLRPPLAALVLVLALGQCAWHALGVHYWSRFAADFRMLLVAHHGYVPWGEAVADLPPEQVQRLRRLDWSWTNPVFSLLLAPRGRIATMIGRVDEQGWQPFDPKRPEQLPQAPQFDYAPYLRALDATGQ
jgi:hypothetical protein